MLSRPVTLLSTIPEITPSDKSVIKRRLKGSEAGLSVEASLAVPLYNCRMGETQKTWARAGIEPQPPR